MTDKYLKGPNQIIEETDGLTTTKPDGAVKLRQPSPNTFQETPPLSVPGMLESTAKKFPDHLAMAVKRSGNWEKMTYKDYYSQSRVVAKAFIALGLERFHAVSILGFNSPEWFMAQMGAIMAGGLSVGIYTTNTPEACRYVAHNCRANIIVVEDEKQLDKIVQVKDQLPHLKAIVQYNGTPKVPDVLSWNQLLEKGNQESDAELEDRLKRIAVNQCCALIYTSGTTGQPKGTMMSHDNFTWTARMSNKYLNVTDKDVLLSYLPLSHSAAQMMDVWMMMAAGASVYFANKDALKGSLGPTLKEVRPTFFFGVPRVFEKIAEKMQEMGKSAPALRRSLASWAKKTGLEHNTKVLEGQESGGISYPIAKRIVFSKVKAALGLDKARLIGVGAAPMSRETFDYFLSLDVFLLECYGMSETSGPQTGNKPGSHFIGTVGQTMTGCVTKINDPDPDGKGEVCMNSRNVMMGYLFNPEKTAEAVDADGWMHSGDIGLIDDNGCLRITGRIKELIITAGGENVPPLIIEDAIKAELPCISNVMVVGDRKKFLSCLLTFKVKVDPDTMEPTDELMSSAVDFFAEKGIKVKTVDDIMRPGADNDRAMRAIQEGIDRANAQATSNAQKIQKYLVLLKDFSVPGGELGPTLKLKRHYVLSKYETQIQNLYNV